MTTTHPPRDLPLTPTELYRGGGCISSHHQIINPKAGCGGGCFTSHDGTPIHGYHKHSSPVVVAVSGRPGSAKNYFATALTEELHEKGYSVATASFAKPIFTELTNIADDIRTELPTNEISAKYNLTLEAVAELTKFLNSENDLGPKHEYGYSRRNIFYRKALNVLTLARREQDPNYYINQLVADLPEADFITITDIRFPNEADWVNTKQGYVLRAVENEVWQKANSTPEDGYKYSAEGLNNPVETALDNYDKFYSKVEYGYFDEKVFTDELLSKIKVA